jgi:hypothetical protein
VKLSTYLATTALVLIASGGVLSAQTAATSTAPAKPAAVAPANPSTVMDKKAASPEKSAKSKECSARADAKGLHGKDRKKFRSQCKAGKS